MLRPLLFPVLAVLALGATARAPAALQPAFRGTIVSTYPDGRTAKLWLNPDGTYRAEGRRHDPSSGRWRIKGDKICLKQAQPPTLPFSYCTGMPANGMREPWRGKAVTGEQIVIHLARIDERGKIWLQGRARDLIVLPNGMNVWPQDVEDALRTAPAVQDASVVAAKRMHNDSVRLEILLPVVNHKIDRQRQRESILLSAALLAVIPTVLLFPLSLAPNNLSADPRFRGAFCDLLDEFLLSEALKGSSHVPESLLALGRGDCHEPHHRVWDPGRCPLPDGAPYAV